MPAAKLAEPAADAYEEGADDAPPPPPQRVAALMSPDSSMSHSSRGPARDALVAEITSGRYSSWKQLLDRWSHVVDAVVNGYAFTIYWCVRVVAQTSLRTAARPANGTISYLASDGLGSANVTLSGSGSATASQLYAPYGGVRYGSGTMPTSYGFTGQRSDASSGLDYYGARYYDPLAGQFTSADTVLSGGGFDLWGLSRFAYVEGNPINRTDPTGHINLMVGDDGSAVPIENAFSGTYSWGGAAVTYHSGFLRPYPASRSVEQRISPPAAVAPTSPKAPDTHQGCGWSNIGACADQAARWVLNGTSSPVYAPKSEDEAIAAQAQADRDNADWFNNAVGGCDISAHCSDLALALMAAGDGRVRWEGDNPRNVHIGKGGEARGTTDLTGGDAAARTKFQQLTGRAPSGSADIAQLPDGTYVTYRKTSSSGTPAVSINTPGVKYETIHFKP